MVAVAAPLRNCFVDLDSFKSNCFPSIVGGIHNLLKPDPAEPLELLALELLELLELLVPPPSPPAPPVPELPDDVAPVLLSPPPQAIVVIPKKPEAIVAKNRRCIGRNHSRIVPESQALHSPAFT